MSFDIFTFHPRIQAGIQSAGYTTPTDIQNQTIQPVLDGRDVMGLAQTGTGKTAAFALPMLQRLMDRPRGRLRALVLSPTRELAEQTHMAFQALGRQTGLRSLTVYGGVSQIPQVKALRAGAEIAVACPGRLLDLMSQKMVDLTGIEVLVLDEADMMFDMGFLPTIRRILAALPKDRQTLMFSATMPPEIRTLALEMLKRPVTVEIGASKPVESVRQALLSVDQEEKYEVLLSLLSQAGNGQILVFTRTKHRAKKLSQQLDKAGHSATCLQGNLSQNQRTAAMDGFRSGRVQVMVATDIAARGIDVSQVTHVINFDMPNTADAYTHRVGRTGRMERLGTAYTLATQDDHAMVRSIERLLGRPLERMKKTTSTTAHRQVTRPEATQAAPVRQPDQDRQSARPRNGSGGRVFAGRRS